MISILKRMFGMGSKNLSELVSNGAIIVDVRSRNEFEAGHVSGSYNIPLEQIKHAAEKLKKHPYIILCCLSGSRSGMAEMILRAKGLTHLTNGGGWQNVKKQLNR